tara:strand:+ start:3750 stop:5798 length:2049 start_codon:yes stop_codon:yes gene_type:complete
MLFHRVLDEEDALVHAFERPQREPSWLEAPRSRRVASFAAAGTFLLTFAVVVLTGCLTLVVSPLSDSRFENLDTQPDDAVRCLRLARRADYVVVFAAVGSPAQYLQLLLRMDVTVDEGATNVDIFAERMLKSLTMQCNETEALQALLPYTTCRDVAVVYNGTLRQSYVHTEFGFSNDYVKASQGNRASQLQLDGEMFLVRGYTYWLTSTHYCWAAEGTVDVVETQDVLKFEDYGIGTSTTLVSNLRAFEPLQTTPAANASRYTCANDTHWIVGGGLVSLFPVDAALETEAWLVLGTAFLYEYGSDILDNRRLVVEIGSVCASTLADYKQINSLYRIDCNHAYSYSCQDRPSVPFRRLAEYRLRIDLKDDGGGEIRAAKTRSLSRIPQLSSFTDGLNSAFGRLFVMILTAAVVFVRGSQNASNSKYMMEHVLDTVHCKHKTTVQILEHTHLEVVTDALVTLTALGSRVLVFAYAWTPLLAGEHDLVIFFELLGIGASAVHFLLRYVVLAIRLEFETPLTKLAGPMSICDVSVAVMMAFSEPPLLATHDGRFAAIGRMLIGILMSISVFSRCMFASSICALLSSTVKNSPHYHKKGGNQGYQAVLIFSTVLWVLQAISTAGSFSALFVQPAGYSLTRMLVGDVGEMRYCLLFGVLATGLPTINKVGLRTLEHACSDQPHKSHRS